jgi:hypothetical protein
MARACDGNRRRKAVRSRTNDNGVIEWFGSHKNVLSLLLSLLLAACGGEQKK